MKQIVLSTLVWNGFGFNTIIGFNTTTMIVLAKLINPVWNIATVYGKNLQLRLVTLSQNFKLGHLKCTYFINI